MLIALILSILSLVLIQTWSVLAGDYDEFRIIKITRPDNSHYFQIQQLTFFGWRNAKPPKGAAWVSSAYAFLDQAEQNLPILSRKTRIEPLLNKKAKPRTLNQYQYKPLIDDLKKKN